MKKIPFAVVKMVNIVLLMIPFLICWTLYYEPRTTTVGSKQVSVLVMIIFFLICYYFGQRLDCFRVSILQIRDVIFGEVLATMITDIIMYILIWMLSIHLPNLIPGLITWGGQCVIGVIWAYVMHQSYFSTHPPLRTIVIYDERMGMENLIHEILVAHGILSYSQTLEWKGAVEYCMTDRNGTAIEKKIDTSLNYYGTVLNAQTLEHAVPNLRNSVEKIIVIENKANYESMEYDPKVLYIFCHGYFSPKEVRFLQMLMKTAPEEIQCYHWGDMDYGGIQIFLYNEKNIFPNLIPWKMDVPSYKAALEKEKGIKLCSKKQKKLEALNAGKLEVLKQCILENKMEIEQEMLI